MLDRGSIESFVPFITFDFCAAASVPVLLAAVICMMMALTRSSSILAKFHCHKGCFLCPPEADSGNVNSDDDDSIRDTGILFLPKAQNQSFETAALTGTSHDESEEDEIVVVPPRLLQRKVSVDPSINTSDSTLKQGHSKHKADLQRGNVNVPAAIPSIEETKASVDEKRYFDDDNNDDNDCFYSIQCASRYECADDDQSDASSLTMPSFRHKHEAPGRKRSLTPRSKMLQKVQKAVFNRVKALRIKNVKDRNRTNTNNGIIENVPSCSCLVLLIDPSSQTFEILPVQYFPGVSSVSDILEQIPLQSSFNFRLRFQPYTGLVEISSRTKDGSYQLPQSKPVPMRYSCEFHHYQQQQQQDRTSCKSIMPLVAILPERMSGTSPNNAADGKVNMVETTETLARKLLSEPRVLERLEYLQDVVLSSSAKGEEENEDNGTSNDGQDEDDDNHSEHSG
jgi:hypothetical protein